MKRKFVLACLMLLAAAGSVSAQQKKVRIGLGLEGALPIGSFSNVYKVGAGATFRAAVAVGENGAVTATTGVIAFLPKDFSGVDLKAQLNIPVKVGYKYMLGSKVYGLGETGMTIAKMYAPVVSGSSGKVASSTGSEFTYSAGFGTHLGGLDLSVRYEDAGAGFFGARLGFNF